MFKVLGVLFLCAWFGVLSLLMLVVSVVALLSFKPLAWVVFPGAWLLVALLGPALWRAGDELAQRTGNRAWRGAGALAFCTPAVLGLSAQFLLGLLSAQLGLSGMAWQMLASAAVSALLAALAWRLRPVLARFDQAGFLAWAAALFIAVLFALTLGTMPEAGDVPVGYRELR